MRAYIVVDLGFGDSGKGLLTDYLVRHFEANVVVRYNGGAQAAHNVVTPDGRHHTFSQFGSGTFNSQVKTYLARHVVIHPTALLIEGDILEQKGVLNPFSRLRISDRALSYTPKTASWRHFPDQFDGIFGSAARPCRIRMKSCISIQQHTLSTLEYDVFCVAQPMLQHRVGDD